MHPGVLTLYNFGWGLPWGFPQRRDESAEAQLGSPFFKVFSTSQRGHLVLDIVMLMRKINLTPIPSHRQKKAANVERQK